MLDSLFFLKECIVDVWLPLKMFDIPIRYFTVETGKFGNLRHFFQKMKMPVILDLSQRIGAMGLLCDKIYGQLIVKVPSFSTLLLSIVNGVINF